MKYKELELLVKLWAEQKGILDKATPIAQCSKTVEEVEELVEALQAQMEGKETFINKKGKLVNTKEEIKDAFGDILVTLIIGAELQDLRLEDCLEAAYNIISKRTGKMVDGQFVKDEKEEFKQNLKRIDPQELHWKTTLTVNPYPPTKKPSCEFCITNKGMTCDNCITTNKPL